MLIQNSGVNWGVLGVVKVTFGNANAHLITLPTQSADWGMLPLSSSQPAEPVEISFKHSVPKKKRPLARGHVLFCSSLVVVLRFIST